MEFNYYYGEEAEQFSFIRIPKIMLTEERFSPLSLSAKILYGLLLDRMSLSARNGWLDEEKRVYIIFKIEEIQDILGFSKKKSIDYLNELEQFGLVEKKRRGLGLPSILYIKSFMLPEEENGTSRGVEIDTSVKAKKGTDTEEIVEETVNDQSENLEISVSGDEFCVRGVDLGTSGGAEIALQEVSKREPLEVSFSAPLNNNTKIINTKNNNIKSNPILSEQDGMGMDETNAYKELLMENIEYPYLLERYPYDQELVEGILDIMLEAVLSQKEYTVIASDSYPTELVRSKFLKLNYGHIEYVVGCMQSNTTKVRNIKKYLLAALFNAPSTISGYYRAEVNHDMPQFARAK
ncbi:MAG: replication initiator protein A [Lachnospiraceae bacterium]|nr:replication initiator protein A [Lachnospiraceae bacterium]